VDLVTKAEISFDRRQYFTGDPIQLQCNIRTGGARVTTALVGVDAARPGEGLGTFLATNAVDFQHYQSDTKPRGLDPDQGKGWMFNALLRLKQMQGLPVITPPMFHLTDAGANGDFAKGFADTLKEGTYTFRFRVEGTLPDGSRFSRLFVRSTWVGVRPDPASTVMIWTTLSGLPAGQVGYVLRITPKSASGEFLGPFRGDVIKFHVSGGTLDGGLKDNFDGSYDQRVISLGGDDPIVQTTVYDFPMDPTGPGLGGKGCWRLWKRAIRCTWRAILRLFGIKK
jgi:hypothetical protein